MNENKNIVSVNIRDFTKKKEKLTIEIPDLQDNSDAYNIKNIEDIIPEISQSNTESIPTPLPKMKMFVILIVIMCEMASLMYVAPFLPFMIRSFGIREKDVGNYSGLIISSFMVGQFFSNAIWGLISEKIGIKPVILTGLLTSTISTIIFGFSSSILWSVIIRFIHGLLSGNLGVTKTYLYLITDKTNEAKGFGMFPVGMCIGAIFAPAIGGLLETPSKHWSSIDNNHILHKYPYLLPSLVIAIFPFIAFIIGFIYMDEPYKNNNEKSDENNEENNEENNINKSVCKDYINKNILITIFLYFNIRFSLMGSDNLFPLLLATSKENNGLELTSNTIGFIYMISAVFLMFYSVFIIPILKRYLGTYKLFIIMQILNPIAVFSTSLLSDYNNLDNISLSILSCFFFILKGSFATTSVVLVNLMINNSTQKKYLGRVNGISQSFAAFGSIFGPVLGGLLYTWSISNNRNFPLDIHFSFGTFALVSSINLLVINFINESVGERTE
tara:strand:- start:146 stop:1645 length:1500 start_codon:yes stop_codon:yes gene_type:complete